MSTNTSSPTPRGTFIVIEGLDRAGKTTQTARLVSRLEASGKKVKQMRFPDRTSPIGLMINSYLQGNTQIEDHTIHLLFSANRWEHAASITEAINSGITVVCDRYIHSGMVYSAAKQNPSLSMEWARAPDVGLPRPDVVMFLDLDEEVARGRGAFGEEVYERIEVQRRVRGLFLRVLEKGWSEGMIRVDAGGSVEEVERIVWNAVEAHVMHVETGRMGDRLGLVVEWVDKELTSY